MVNLEIRTTVRILIVSIMFLCNPMLNDIVLGQDGNGIVANLEPKEINGDSFNGELTMTVRNNSKETVYLTLEPFSCYRKSDSIIFYFLNKGGTFCSNEISFFKKDSKIVTGSSVLLITFLKFPAILFLNPQVSTLIKIHINKEELKVLKNLIWDVNFDISFALKSDIDNELVNKPEKIIEEFKNSILYKDTINIDLKLNSSSETEISLYKSISTENYPLKNESIYDTILKNFWHRPMHM